MNNTTRRHPRTLAEAFPCERYGTVFGPYTRTLIRYRWRDRLYWAAAIACLSAIFAAPAIGAFLGFW